MAGYDVNTAICLHSLAPPADRPSRSQRYDNSVAIGRQNTTRTGQFGRKPYDTTSALFTIGIWLVTLLLKSQNPTNPVATLRSERGNLGAKYDASPGQTLKTLRPQFGTKYDRN